MSKHCFVIAEAGLNHNGSLEMAKQLIDCAKDAGADAVKFQKRNVATLATGQVLNAEDKRFPSLGKTYREIRESLEFDEKEYLELKNYTQKLSLQFLCTAFDTESVDFLERLGVQAYKLASHSVTNLPLLKYLASKKKPVYMSSGMCSWDELDAAVKVFVSTGVPLTLFHCVSVYPTPLDQCNLNLIPVLKDRYKIPIGFSGHEIGFMPTLIAVGMGAVAVERHFTLDKKLEGFDHKISLEPQEFKEMVQKIREIESMLGSGEKAVSDIEKITRNKYHVSMVSVAPIAKGTLLKEEMICYKNPGTGIPVKEAHKVLGKKAATDIPADTLLDYSMFQEQ